jgi:hypothetical protein
MVHFYSRKRPSLFLAKVLVLQLLVLHLMVVPGRREVVLVAAAVLAGVYLECELL